MRIRRSIKASVMSSVLVVSVLMLLGVMAVLSLWEADFLLFSRANYMRIQRAHVESAFILYCEDPGIMERLDDDGILQLFEQSPSSRMKISRQPWGLYEVVSVSSEKGDVGQTRIMGSAMPYKDEWGLWYRNNNSSFTVTGNSNIHGKVYTPRNGITYGQMRSVFFNGETVADHNIKTSAEVLPRPSAEVSEAVKRLWDEKAGGVADSLSRRFRGEETTVTNAEGDLSGCIYIGNIILKGDNITIGNETVLGDVLVIGRNVSVADGFSGSCQIFADSVAVGKNVTLTYPSGIYARQYAAIDDGSEVNGYVIVDYGGDINIQRPNGSKSRTSVVRGLLYAGGLFQLQGLVVGTVFLNEAIYYSPQGYYRNMLYDVSVIENPSVAYPLWLDALPGRKEAKWVQ